MAQTDMSPRAVAMALDSAIKITPDFISDVIDYVQQGRPVKVDLSRDRSGTFVSYNPDNFITRSIATEKPDMLNIKSDPARAAIKDPASGLYHIDFSKLGGEIAPKNFVMGKDGFALFAKECDKAGKEGAGISYLAFEALNEKGQLRIYVTVSAKDFERTLTIAKDINHGKFLGLGMDISELKSLAKTEEKNELVRSNLLTQKAYTSLKRTDALYNIPHSVEKVKTSKGNVYVLTTFKDKTDVFSARLCETSLSMSGKTAEIAETIETKKAKEREDLMKALSDSKKLFIIADHVNPDHAILKTKEEISLVTVKPNGEYELSKGTSPIKINDPEWQKLIYKDLVRLRYPVMIDMKDSKQELENLFREKGKVPHTFEERAIRIKHLITNEIAGKLANDPHYKDNLIRLANAQDHAVINKDDNLARDLDDDIALSERAEYGQVDQDLSDIPDSYSALPREAAEQERLESAEKLSCILLGLDRYYDFTKQDHSGNTVSKTNDDIIREAKETSGIDLKETDLRDATSSKAMELFARESPRMHEFILRDVCRSILEEKDTDYVKDISIEDLERSDLSLEKEIYERTDLEEELIIS